MTEIDRLEARERRLVDRLGFKPWCKHCVAGELADVRERLQLLRGAARLAAACCDPGPADKGEGSG